MADEPDDRSDALGRRVAVACAVAEADEEADVTGDAVTDFAKAGQINEQSLLEQRRQRIIEIAELGEPPQARGDLRRPVREPEEVRQHSHPALDLGIEGRVDRRRVALLDGDHGSKYTRTMVVIAAPEIGMERARGGGKKLTGRRGGGEGSRREFFNQSLLFSRSGLLGSPPPCNSSAA